MSLRDLKLCIFTIVFGALGAVLFFSLLACCCAFDFARVTFKKTKRARLLI